MKYTDKGMRCFAFHLSFAIGLFLITQPANAQFIQSFDETRSICEGSFVVGDGYSVARGILAPQGYTFGAGVTSITPEALVGVQIFVINPLGAPLSNREI